MSKHAYSSIKDVNTATKGKIILLDKKCCLQLIKETILP